MTRPRIVIGELRRDPPSSSQLVGPDHAGVSACSPAAGWPVGSEIDPSPSRPRAWATRAETPDTLSTPAPPSGARARARLRACSCAKSGAAGLASAVGSGSGSACGCDRAGSLDGDGEREGGDLVPLAARDSGVTERAAPGDPGRGSVPSRPMPSKRCLASTRPDKPDKPDNCGERVRPGERTRAGEARSAAIARDRWL